MRNVIRMTREQLQQERKHVESVRAALRVIDFQRDTRDPSEPYDVGVEWGVALPRRVFRYPIREAA